VNEVNNRRKTVRLLLVILLLCSCGAQPTSGTTAPILGMADRVKLYSKAGEEIFVHRCDNLTFKSLWAAYVTGAPGMMPIEQHFYDESWHRDIIPCYDSSGFIVVSDEKHPNDSRSEISYDGLLALVHYLNRVHDSRTLNELFEYGKDNNWVFGEGLKSLTWVPQLAPLVNSTLLTGSTSKETSICPFTGFRARLEIVRMLLEIDTSGSLDFLDKQLLSNLAECNPGAPLVLALATKQLDREYTNLYTMLQDESVFPSDRIPLKTGSFGWGSCPDSLTYLMSVAILEGR